MAGNRLPPSEVAHAIRATLAGAQSKAELGRWAFLAILRDDTDARPFHEEFADEMGHIIYDLMFMDEGTQYELSDDDLRTMLAKLDALESDSGHRTT